MWHLRLTTGWHVHTRLWLTAWWHIQDGSAGRSWHLTETDELREQGAVYRLLLPPVHVGALLCAHLRLTTGRHIHTRLWLATWWHIHASCLTSSRHANASLLAARRHVHDKLLTSGWHAHASRSGHLLLLAEHCTGWHAGWHSWHSFVWLHWHPHAKPGEDGSAGRSWHLAETDELREQGAVERLLLPPVHVGALLCAHLQPVQDACPVLWRQK